MSDATPLPERLGLTVEEGPWRAGSELRWRVRHEGQPALLGQLLPELAHDPSLRRRYVRDLERMAALGEVALARIVDRGPSPEPRDPAAAPPWRLREDPPGESLEAWLQRRAPAPADEVAEVIAQLADRLHEIHAHGVVLRDLNPRLVMRGDGRTWLTDVGLARVDVLSTRTAASLLLEGSPYCAPELLEHTVVDQRADVYGLGVLMFRALTGELPGGDAHALLRPPGPPPRARARRADVPPALDELVARCMAEDPAHRPGSAAEVADALRGRAGPVDDGTRVVCQACGTGLRPGQRLCTQCGQLAVQFSPVAEGQAPYDIVLRKIGEQAEPRAHLLQVLGAVAEGPVPPLNFLVGDQRMYSKAERKRLIKLPVRLVGGLGADDATRLAERLRVTGVDVQPKASDDLERRALSPRQRRGLMAGWISMMAVSVALMFGIGGMAGAVLGAGGIALSTLVMLLIRHAMRRHRVYVAGDPPLVQLRAAPAALPASDPLVSRLAALLQRNPPDDLREQLGELALAVQRLHDHRARHAGEGAEIDAVTAPVAELVRLVEGQVHAIERIDAELRDLDEGALVRALAAAEARSDPPAAREELLHGLDRLRALEDARARRFHRLLEATRLAHRSVELGLSVHDAEQEHERSVAAALQALEHELEGDEDSAPAALPAPVPAR